MTFAGYGQTLGLGFMAPPLTIVLVTIGLVVWIFILAVVWMSRYFKVGPNQVLIVSGRMHVLPDGTKRGFRIVRGGGTFVLPVIEKKDVLSLEVVRVAMPGLRILSGGTAASVECVAQVKIQTDEASILAAAECFLNKSAAEIQEIVRPVLEKHARAVVGRSNAREIEKGAEQCEAAIREAATPDLREMGLGIVSLSVR